jgi:membrane fusion protein (multidrug efflux system)
MVKRFSGLLPETVKKVRLVLERLLVISSVLIVSGCERTQHTPPSLPPPEVLVTEVIQQDVPIHSEWVGTTDGYVNAQIRARVQGYLQAQNYKEGAVVKQGDLMFTIDPRQYQAALEEALGDLGRAEANYGKTQLDVTRYTPLAKEGAISQQELDNAIQANQANKASVEGARAAVENAKLNLSWTKVTSPITGIAGIAVVQLGDLVTPTSVLTTVSQVDPIKVYFPISEQEYLGFAKRIREAETGVTPRDRISLDMILSDGSTYSQKGTPDIVNRQVDVKTGTMTVAGLFPNPDNLLRPGQYAKVRAVTRVANGAALVPQRAVQELQGSYQVVVIGTDDKAEIRPVKVGEWFGTMWVIESGVKPGERVVVEGLQKLRAGMPVVAKPLPAQSASEKPTATAAVQ